MRHDIESSTTAPILIVGAGPAGLVTAIGLARQGIAALLVEKREGLSPFPRATGISTRTMEIVRSWGLEDRVRAGEIDAGTGGWVSTTLASPDGMAVSLGFPSRAHARTVSPTTPVIAPQDHLEPVLLDHLRDLGRTDIRFGTELVTLDQDDEGVTAVLREHASGRHTIVRCAYVVGADGAHSAVRTGLGIAMDGPGELGDFLAVLFRAPLDEVVGDRRHGLYMIQGSAQIEVFLPAGGGRWIYSRSTEGRTDHPRAELLELIRAGAGVPDLAVDVLRVGTFAFAAQFAERFRDGRAFLAGDAAHRVTPRGGTGMNTAIHDGYDLAWKLGWVLRGWAPATLLDSYETERRPVGVRNTLNSAQPVRDQGEAFVADLAGRLPHVWQRRSGGRMSTLDMIGPGLTLITGPCGAAWHHEAAGLAGPLPLTVDSVDHAAAAAFDIGAGGAVLVRPDGQLAHRWPATAGSGELSAAVAAVVCGEPSGPAARPAALAAR